MQDEEHTQEAEEPVAEEAEEQPAPETPGPSPKKPANEMKVVIIIKDKRIMLGVQSPDCDPVYTTMEGSLAMALKKVTALVAEAKQKWEATPLYPKAVLPEPAPRPTPVRPPAAPKAKPAQKTFF